MQPPERFTEALKRLDPKLVIGWNQDRCRWLIARDRELGNGRTLIMWVEEPDGAYRPLDNRTIALLKRFDSWNIGKEQYVNNLMEAMDQEREASFDRACENFGEAHEKAQWALKKDTGDYVLGVDRQQQIDFERQTEERLRQLRASW